METDVMIYLIDGNRLSRDLYSTYLRQVGFRHTRSFASLDEWWAATNMEAGVLILDDAILKGSSREFVNQVKECYFDMYIVGLTQVIDSTKAQAALDAGLFDILLKDRDTHKRLREIIYRIERISNGLQVNPAFHA